MNQWRTPVPKIKESIAITMQCEGRVDSFLLPPRLVMSILMSFQWGRLILIMSMLPMDKLLTRTTT